MNDAKTTATSPHESPRELRLTMRISNNRIRQRREDLGFSSRHRAADAAEISYPTWCGLESLKRKPFTIHRRGDRIGRVDWSQVALKMANFLKVTPDWLWPEAVLAVVQPTVTTEIDAIDLRPALVAVQLYPELPSPEQNVAIVEDLSFLQEALKKLTPIEENVLRRRFGLDEEAKTLGQIGDDFDRSREVIRKVESRAILALRKQFRVQHTERYLAPPNMVPVARPWWWCPKCKWTRKAKPLPAWRTWKRGETPDCFECGSLLHVRPIEVPSEPEERESEKNDPSTPPTHYSARGREYIRLARGLVEQILYDEPERWWTLSEMVIEIEGSIPPGFDVEAHAAAYALTEMERSHGVRLDLSQTPVRYRIGILNHDGRDR